MKFISKISKFCKCSANYISNTISKKISKKKWKKFKRNGSKKAIRISNSMIGILMSLTKKERTKMRRIRTYCFITKDIWSSESERDGINESKVRPRCRHHFRFFSSNIERWWRKVRRNWFFRLRFIGLFRWFRVFRIRVMRRFWMFNRRLSSAWRSIMVVSRKLKVG